MTTFTCSWTQQQALFEKLHVPDQPATLFGGRSAKFYTTITL